MKYKLLCVDVDGTLACDDKSISSENIYALQQASLAGINIVIASGRTPLSLKSLFNRLGLPEYMICLNGAYVEVCGQTIGCQNLSLQQLQKAYEIIEYYQTSATFSTPEFSIRNHDVSSAWKKQIAKGSLKADYIIANTQSEYKELIFSHSREIVKISILERNQKKYNQIRKAFEKTQLFTVAKSDVDYIDITDLRSTKGKAVSILSDFLGIGLEEIICIGDNENDLEMLDIAGLSIAMKNAVPSLLNRADVITDDNNHNGVAKAIDQYILGGVR